MSLILEALRKSEAERRRGQTPDLLSDALPAPAAVRRSQANWALVGAVAAAATVTLLVVAWWLRTPGTSPAAAEAAQARPAMVAETTAAPPEADVPAPQTQAQPQPQASLSPPVLPSRAPAVPAPTATAPQPVADAAATAPPAMAVASSRPAPASVMPAAAPPRPTTAPSPAAAKPEPALPSPQQVASLEAAPPARAPASAFASPDMPVRLSDLSAEDRQQLPTLKVSMHMWAPDAGSRFAIIDGARVNEGDRVGDATVEAILQDGVMLSWHGRQIRLPLR